MKSLLWKNANEQGQEQLAKERREKLKLITTYLMIVKALRENVKCEE